MSPEFKSEQAQISQLENDAAQKKADKLKSMLENRHNIFFAEADKADGVYLATINALNEPKYKELLASEKEKIRSYMGQVASTGQEILAQEKPENAAQYPTIAQLSTSVGSTIEKLKKDAPVYLAVEQLKKSYSADLEPALNKAKTLKDKPKLTQKQKEEVLGKAEAASAESFKKLSGINQANVPSEIRAVYEELNLQIMAAANEIGQTRIDLMSDEEKNKNPDLLKIDETNRQFRALDQDIDKADELFKKIKDSKQPEAQYKKGIEEMLASADQNINKLIPLKNTLSKIDARDLPPQFANYLETEKSAVGMAISQMLNIKLYAKRMEFVERVNKQKGRIVYVRFNDTQDYQANKGTEYENRSADAQHERAVANNYFTFNRDGTITPTDHFKKLTPPEKQRQIWEEMQNGPLAAVYAEMEKKSASEDVKDYIEGKKKFDAGDWRGAKKDLLKFQSSENARKPENANTLQECNELLKQIALKEVGESGKRLESLRKALETNGIAWGKSPDQYLPMTEESKQKYQDLGITDVNLWDSANRRYGLEVSFNTARYLEAQEAMLRKAFELIESGQCLTFEQAQARLGSTDISEPEILKKEREQLAALEAASKKMDTQKPDEYKADKIKSLQELIDKAKNDPKQLDALEQELEKLKKEDPKKYYVAQKALTDSRKKDLINVIEEHSKQHKRDLESQLLFRQANLPQELKDIYDIFDQQKNLNNSDPAAREAYIRRIAQQARDHNLPELAQSLLETFFEKELEEARKKLTRAEVMTRIDNEPSNRVKFEEQVKESIKSYEKNNPGTKVTPEIRLELQRRARAEMVNIAYDRELKLLTHATLQQTPGARTDLWNDSFGNIVGNVQNIGVNKIEFSDKEWKELGPRLAIQLGVMATAAAVSGGLAAGATNMLLEGGMSQAGASAFAFTVESAAFTATQGGLDAIIHRNLGIFESGESLFESWAEGAATIGLFKGVHVLSEMGGIGALSAVEREALSGTRSGNAIFLAQSGERWVVRQTAGGLALTSFNAEMAWLKGHEYTYGEAAKGFLDNFALMAGMEAGHAFRNVRSTLPVRAPSESSNSAPTEQSLRNSLSMDGEARREAARKIIAPKAGANIDTVLSAVDEAHRVGEAKINKVIARDILIRKGNNNPSEQQIADRANTLSAAEQTEYFRRAPLAELKSLYTQAELMEKARILRNAGLDLRTIDRLMRSGVSGGLAIAVNNAIVESAQSPRSERTDRRPKLVEAQSGKPAAPSVSESARNTASPEAHWELKIMEQIRDIKPTRTDPDKPWISTHFEITSANGTKVEIKAEESVMEIRSRNGLVIAVPAYIAGHIFSLHLKGHEAGSTFAQATLVDVMRSFAERMPAEIDPSKGCLIDFGQVIGQEGITPNRNEMLVRGIVTTQELAHLDTYKNEAFRLNLEGTKDEKISFVERANRSLLGNVKLIVRAETIVPIYMAQKPATNLGYMAIRAERSANRAISYRVATIMTGRPMDKLPADRLFVGQESTEGVAKDTKVADLIRREKAGAELTTAEKSLVEAQRKAQDCWWEGGFIETPKPAEKPVVSTEIPTTVPPAALSKPTTPESGAMSRSQKTMDVIKLRQNLETLVADGKIKSETANEIISALNESGSFNEARLKAIRSKLGPANRLVNAAIEASRASETPTENARGNLRIENVNGVEVAVQQPAATSEPGAPSEFNAALRASGGRLRFGLIPKGSQRVAPRVKRGNAPDSPTRGFSRVDFVDVNSAVLDHHQRTGENVCATDLVIRPETIEAIRNGSSERRMLVAHEKPDVDSIASTTLFMMIRNGEIKGNEAAVKRLVDYTHNEDLLVWDAPTASGEHANLAYLLDLISGKIGSSSLSQNILQYEVGYEIIKRIIQKNLDPTHLRLADFLDMQGNPLSFATKKYGLNSAIEKAIGNMLGQNAKKFIDSIRQILPDILNGNNRLFNELCNKMAIDPDVARQLSVLLNDRQNITVTQGEPVRIETFLAEGGSGKPSAYEAWRNKHFEKFEKLIAGGKNQFTLPALPNGEVPKGLYDPSGKVLEPAEIYRRGFSVIFSGKTVWLRPDYAESPGAKERLVQAFRELERAETAERKRLYNENPGKYNRSEFLREGKVRPGYEGYGPEEGGNSNPWGHGADHSYLVQPSGSNRSVLPNEVIQNIIMHGLNITNSTF